MALSTALSTVNPYVTVTRTAADGSYSLTRTVAGVVTPVRGTLVVTGGTGDLVDREAPQGVSVTYTVEADTTVVVTNKVGAWLIHPTNQALDRAVTVSTYPTWTYGVRQDSVVPLGSSYPIVVSDVRQAREGDGFSLVVQGETAATNLAATIASSRVLLLSTYDFPAPYVWVALGPEQWEPQGSSPLDPIWLVSASLTEVERPELVSSGVVTWLDVDVRYADWTAIDADFPTIQALIDAAESWVS